LYDYGARFYDPVIGRWGAVDPLVEDGQETTSPYGYVFDDPVKLTDPDGRAPCCKVQAGAVLGGTAGGIFAASLAAGGTVATAGSATIVGAPVGIVVGAGIIVGGALGAGAMWLWDHAHHSEASTPPSASSPEKKPEKKQKTNKKDEPVEIKVDRKKYPESAQHLEDAINNGVNNEGTVDREGAKARRKQKLKDTPTQTGKDRDEVPPAVIDNGNGGSSVKHIPPSDNRGAGASIGKQLNNIPNGTRVKIIPTN